MTTPEAAAPVAGADGATAAARAHEPVGEQAPQVALRRALDGLRGAAARDSARLDADPQPHRFEALGAPAFRNLHARPDLRDGAVRLHLPEGFSYRSFHDTESPVTLDDGTVLPGRHDGMAAFPGPRNTVVWRNAVTRR